MFKTKDILQKRYRLQQPLGRTAAGHQTWLAVDLSSQNLSLVSRFVGSWQTLKKLKFLNFFKRFSNPKLEEQITVKLLAFSPQMQWEELKLFEREAQVLQTLNHPHIPRYRDYFNIDKNLGGGVPWFAMVQDYIAGSSLQELLEQGNRFSEKEIRSIATEILEILIYLHELSPPILHRDIKPSNLILGKNKHIYLIDFGAVQAQASITGVTFTVVGTSGYAPLEQFWGRAVPVSDLYALGATLIHLLTGIAPVDLPLKDSRIQFADRVSINANLVRWLEKLTEVTIEKRYSNAREALEALKAIDTSLQFHYFTGEQSSPLQKSVKPDWTQVKLFKSDKTLEINLPSGRLNTFKKIPDDVFINYGFLQNITSISSLFFLSLIVAPVMLTAVALIINTVPLLFLIFGILGLIHFLTVVLLLLIYLMIWFGEKTYIYFEQSQFKFSRQTLGIKYNLATGCNKDIIGIFLHNQQDNYQVSINTKDNIYFLGNSLGKDEAAWLVKEIQNWLK